MKRTLLITCILLALAAVAMAARENLQRDRDGAKIQGFAPNGTKNTTLAVYRQGVDMRNDIAWSAYTPTACKFRTMTTATVRGATQTLPASTRTTMHVNSSTPFLNFTGCTNGELLRQ